VHRLGFDPLVLQSADEVWSQEERTGEPHWALLIESDSGLPISFAEFRRLLPHTRLVVCVQDADHRPEAEAVGAMVQRAPLSLRDLASSLVLRQSRRSASLPAKLAKSPRIRRVLLVEDNAVSQLIVAELLGQLGLQVILASTGEDGVNRFREHAPDAVLMDIGLPGIDGLEAAKRIRAIQQKGLVKRCPIVALTASALDSSRDVWNQAGLDGFLAKPVSAAAIDAEFQRLARRDRQA
jgi:CheY-like chemotaxis protein